VLASFPSAFIGILGTGKCFTAAQLHELCIWLKIASLYFILYQIIIRFSPSASHGAEQRLQPFGQEVISPGERLRGGCYTIRLYSFWFRRKEYSLKHAHLPRVFSLILNLT
jgi:hypothetical protein